MFKTGNNFIDFTSAIVAFLPLLPVIIILFRRVYQKDVLNYLMILCLINFSQNLVVLVSSTKYLNPVSIQNIFSLLEFVVIIQILKSTTKGLIKEIVNILTIAILSSIITYYLLKGSDQKKIIFDILGNGFIISLTFYCLVIIIRNDNLKIFYSPLFWVSTGLLFYFTMNTLLNIIDNCCLQLRPSITNDKVLILNIASFAQYLFYTLAALFYRKN